MTDPLSRLADAAERIAAALERLADRDRPGAGAGIARLLAAWHAAAGEQPMRASQIVELAHSPLVHRAALRAAVGDRNPKALGKLLAQHEGQPVEGFTLRREPGRRWSVRAFETAQTRSEFNPWRI